MNFIRLKTIITDLLLLLFIVSSANAQERWIETDPTELNTGDTIVIADKNSARAMTNNNGTGKEPDAEAVTLSTQKTEITSQVSATLQWVVSRSNNSYAFQKPGSVNYLYGTVSSLRVGTNSNRLFQIVDGFLKNIETKKYLGVNNDKWNCYDNIDTNIKSTVLTFYKKSDTPASLPDGLHYTKVTDATELRAGDKFIIAHQSARRAMTTNQRNDNRTSVSIFFSDNECIINEPDVQIITLEGEPDAWYFNTGNGYLSTSGTKNTNQLLTQKEKTEDTKASIAINNSKTEIRFYGKSNRNLLCYNSNNDGYFSCYGSASGTSSTVQLYRLNEGQHLTLQLSASRYRSYCSDYALDFSSNDGHTYRAWYIDAIEGSTVHVKEIKGPIKSGTPFFLYGEPEAICEISITDNGSELTDNLMKGTLCPTPIETIEGNYTNMGISGGELVKIGNGILPANKAYLPVPTSLLAYSSRITVAFDDETTAIKGIQQVHTNRPSYYNLYGQRMSSINKGLMIYRGKKLMVK